METNTLINQLFTKNRKAIADSIKALHDLSLNDKTFELKASFFINPNKPKYFSLFIFDIFYIKGKGVLVTGIVSSGSIKTGTKLLLQKSNNKDLKTKVLDIEYFGNQNIIPGNQLGIFLKNISVNDIKQGDVLISRPFWSFL